MPLLELRDQCGNTATVSSPGQAGTCFNLTFTGDTSGDAGTVWQVACLEGNCDPKCADRTPP